MVCLCWNDSNGSALLHNQVLHLSYVFMAEQFLRQDKSTSVSLLRRVKSLEPDAWSRLVELYAPVVYDWCRVSGIGAHDAADISQDVFRAVFMAIGRFRRDEASDSFRGWLWTITRNKIRDFANLRRKRAQAAGGSEAVQWLNQVAEMEAAAESLPQTNGALQRALHWVQAEFEERTWQAFWRTAVDGVAAPTAAEELGMTPGAVRKAKFRVLRRLRDELEDLHD